MHTLHNEYVRDDERIFFHLAVDVLAHHLAQIVFERLGVLDESRFHVQEEVFENVFHLGGKCFIVTVGD